MIDWTAVGSIATALAVCVAVAALVIEGRRSRFATGIELIMRLNDQFGSATFRRIRYTAAQYLRNADAHDRALYYVLDFFAMVAYLWDQEVLASLTIWYTFGSWIIPYYRLSKPIIEKLQKTDPTVYHCLAKLCEEILHIDNQQKRPYTVLALRNFDEENKKFLDDECSL